MSKATDPSKALASLIKKIKSAGADPSYTPQDNMVAEFVFSYLLYESTTRKAELALERLLNEASDYNELRTFTEDDLAYTLGVNYPGPQDRVARLKLGLNEIYNREHAVSLDSLTAHGKRDGRKYAESIEAIPPFVSARISLLAAGSHAIPLDERTASKLIKEEVLSQDEPLAKQQAALERMVKAGEGLATHQLLQAWSEDAVSLGSGKTSSKSRSTRKAGATG